MVLALGGRVIGPCITVEQCSQQRLIKKDEEEGGEIYKCKIWM